MKTELLAQTGWRGKLNDRVLSASFRTLEDLHIPRSRLVSVSMVEPHTCGGCLTLAHSMPWFGHTVQNRDTARSVWMTMLHIGNGRYGEFV